MPKKVITAREQRGVKVHNIESFDTASRGEGKFRIESFEDFERGEKPFTVESFFDAPRGESKMNYVRFRETDLMMADGSDQDASIVTSSDSQRIFVLQDFVAEELIVDPERAARVHAELAEEKDTRHEPTSEEVMQLEETVARLQAELEETKLQLAAEKERADALTASLPTEKETARKQGYDIGKADGVAEATRQYEAEKADYMAVLQAMFDEAKGELSRLHEVMQQLDEQIPELIITFLKEIIGIERKVNDRIVLSVIRQNLERVMELENVVFLVHPFDLAAVREAFPEYGAAGENSIRQGGVKIRSKIGEIDLSIETLVANLETQIHEELAASQEN